MNKRVFSGIQPTGLVHIGNYLGAIKTWVELQHDYESLFCIVDYHAITVPYGPGTLPANVFDAAVMNIAAGLDPKVAIIFVQSHVPEHTELAWILNTITPMGRLSHMTQFRDKSRQAGVEVNAGLFNYPILQAADILLYKAEIVPVGEDQVQHIELTRDIARKFNGLFGEMFPIPKPHLSQAPRVMSLADPTKKMSKSIPGSYIALSDPPNRIREQVMHAVTDSGPQPGAPMSPGTANLFTLLDQFSSPETVKRFKSDYEAGTLRYLDLKRTLADDITVALDPIRRKREELLSNPEIIHAILSDGAQEARAIAKATMAEVKQKMGLT